MMEFKNMLGEGARRNCQKLCFAQFFGRSENSLNQNEKTLAKFKRDINNLKESAFKGFTLAEVLITLAIIGVVAALTIPTLITNYQNQQF